MNPKSQLSRIMHLLIGAMIALAATGEFRFAIGIAIALVVIPFLYAILAAILIKPAKPSPFKDAPKVIHLHVPLSTCDMIRESAAKADVTLAQFSSMGLTLAIRLVDTIKSKGRIVFQRPNQPDEVIDTI